MSIPKNKALLENAKELRKNMTRQERHLWYDFLRDYPVKIYKQKIIGKSASSLGDKSVLA